MSVSALYVVCRHGVCGPGPEAYTFRSVYLLLSRGFRLVAANSMVGRASRAAPLYDEALAQPPDSEAAGRNATAAHGIMVRSILTVTSGVSAAVSVAAAALAELVARMVPPKGL